MYGAFNIDSMFLIKLSGLSLFSKDPSLKIWWSFFNADRLRFENRSPSTGWNIIPSEIVPPNISLILFKEIWIGSSSLNMFSICQVNPNFGIPKAKKIIIKMYRVIIHQRNGWRYFGSFSKIKFNFSKNKIINS